VSSPGNTVQGLITVFEASREAIGGRMALNLPGLNVQVSDMLAALEKVAGPEVRARVTFVKDERIAGIVDNWAKGCTFDRAHALGLRADASFEAIIEQYIADCKTRPGYPAEALKGLRP
jgi:nucleoside-diphosphate-sugar epimerase